MKKSTFDVLRNTVCCLAVFGFMHPLAQAQQKRMVGYWPEWRIYDGIYPKDLVTSGSAQQLTHVLYAFSNISTQGTCELTDTLADFELPVSAADSVNGVADGASGTLRGNFHQLLELKKLYPNLKVMISIGGWSESSGFSAAASTEASRKAFVSSCISTFIEGNFKDPSANYNVTQPGIFDGIDIDWEYPGACGDTCSYSPEDTENFTLLLAEFRNELNTLTAKTREHYTLSIAAPAGETDYSLIQLPKIPQYLDFVNLMTYDMHGGWNLYADHAAPLFTSPLDPVPGDKHNNVDSTVSAYLAGGVPAEELNVGIPFYGHGWMGVPNIDDHGLYQSATGPAPDDQAYYNVLNTLPGFNGYYDPLSGLAYWIYDGKGTFYSFDNQTSVFAKALYIRGRRLGGAMFWDLTGDDTKGTLVHSISRGLQQGF